MAEQILLDMERHLGIDSESELAERVSEALLEGSDADEA